MPYLVIDADRVIVSGGIVATQAAADTLALTDSDWTAHQGDVTGGSFHANAEPGWVLTTAGATVRALPLTPLRELKNLMSEAHHYLVELQAGLHHEGSGRPWEEVVKVHDFMARVHQSNFRIVSDNPQTLTVVQRTAYAKALLAGPQSATDVRYTLSELFTEISEAAIVLGGQGVTYVNPGSGAQITIANAHNMAQAREMWGLGTDTDVLVVTEVQLVSGLWTEGITV